MHADWLPHWFEHAGPQGLTYGQWIALPTLTLLAWILGALLSRLTQRLLRPVAARTATEWDDALIERMRGPVTIGWALLLSKLSLPWLELPPEAREVSGAALSGLFFLGFFWALGRVVDIAGQVLLGSPWARLHPASRSLIPLAARVAKAVIAAMAVIALLSDLGYPVASLLAGLGIGGLAMALAAQKTVENLFGAFTLGADQPFREGDSVKVDDLVGTVESIGLRSTRIRTADRTLVTIPNGKLAELRIETFAARDRMRMHVVIGLVYGTTSAQIRKVLANIEQALREHPKVWKQSVIVRFMQLGASSLDIEVTAWFETRDGQEYNRCRQEMLLRIMEIVEQAGTSFAFPTQTVHLVRES